MISRNGTIKMGEENLIEFVKKNGTANDKVNLLKLNDFQLRTIVQRLISEKRLGCQKQNHKV